MGYLPGMGFYVTDLSRRSFRAKADSVCARQEKTHLPLKNRVGGLRRSPALRARRSAPQPLEPHRENGSTPTTTASGVRYYGYRYYDPEMGRWLSRDPIGERGGVNLYHFVRNSPVEHVDMVGLYIPPVAPPPIVLPPVTLPTPPGVPGELPPIGGGAPRPPRNPFPNEPWVYIRRACEGEDLKECADFCGKDCRTVDVCWIYYWYYPQDETELRTGQSQCTCK